MNYIHKDRMTGNSIRSITIKIISIILIILPLLSSCLKEEADNHERLPNRTVLFYMAGDNSLSEETQEKVDALAAAWNIGGENHLLVYQDRGTDYAPRLLEIKTGADGKGVAEVLEEYEPENSASGAVFARVLTDVVLRYPASDYGLIMFSHGSGWLPAGTHLRPRSVAMDDDREFELRDFASAIPNGQFSFIVFESCLMAGVEVAFELKDKTEYILASSAEIVSPGFTPLYGKMLKRLYKMTPELTGFAQDYYEYYNLQSGDNRSATVSVIRGSELVPLKPFLARLEKQVEHWEWVERGGIQHFDRRQGNYLYYDLEGYIRVLGSESDINELAGILDKAVVYKAATESFMPETSYGYQIRQHCGLTIYIPVTQYSYLNTQRKRLLLFTENKE